MEYLSTINKRFVLLGFLILVSTNLIAQGSTSFFKTYTGGLFDFGQGITQLDNGKYAVTGSTSSLGDNSSKALLMVIDEEGNHEWTKGYGGANSDWGRRIFHETGSGFWIAGYSNSYGDASFDFTLLKTDESGELEWEQHYGTADRERLWDAIRIDDGSFILVGETEGALSDGKDILMMRVDEDGELMWTERIDNEGDDVGYAVTSFDDTTFLLAGDYHNNGETSGLIVKMHIDGTFIEQWIYDQDGPASFRDIKRFDEQTYVCGSVNSTSLDYVNTVILRLDEDYNITHSEVGSAEGDDFASAMEILGNNRLYWSVKTTAAFFNVFPGGWGSSLIKYTRTMAFIPPSIPFSGFNDDEITQIIGTADGGLICIGSCSNDRSDFSYGSDVMIAKIGPNDEHEVVADEGNDLVNIIEFSVENDHFVYPNPTEGLLNVSDKFQYKDMKLYNMVGQLQEDVKYHKSKIDLSNLPNGVYFLVVQDDLQFYSLKVVKK